MPERALSESIGFVLVFALVVSTIGIVYASGFAGLQDVRDAEQTNNAQRAFEVLADNMEDITKRGAPSRATEVKVENANLYVDDPITINVSVPEDDFSIAHDVHPIVYDANTGEQLFYAQGAIIRAREGGSGFVVHESTLVLNQSRTVVPVIQTRLEGVGSVGGGGTALIRAEESKTALEYSNMSAANTVWVNITSPRADAWANHLEDSPDVTCEPVSDNTAACQVTSDQIRVSVFKIDVSLV